MSEVLEFSVDGGIRQIAVKNENDEVVTVLKINVADATTAERFANIIDNLQKVSDDAELESERLREKYKEKELKEGKIDTQQIIDVCQLKVDYIKRFIVEINDLFGENTIQNVYKDCYDLNPEFVPDEYILLDFVDKAIPVMNQLFNKRFEENRKKYNVGRRGKHNKSKKELIQGFKERSGAGE